MGGLYESIAFKILKKENKALTCKQIILRAYQYGMLDHVKGKTPILSLDSFLYRDVKKPYSLFRKVGAGKFTLKITLTNNLSYVCCDLMNDIEHKMDIAADNFIKMDQFLKAEEHMFCVANKFINLNNIIERHSPNNMMPYKFKNINTIIKNNSFIKY